MCEQDTSNADVRCCERCRVNGAKAVAWCTPRSRRAGICTLAADAAYSPYRLCTRVTYACCAATGASFPGRIDGRTFSQIAGRTFSQIAGRARSTSTARAHQPRRLAKPARVWKDLQNARLTAQRAAAVCIILLNLIPHSRLVPSLAAPKTTLFRPGITPNTPPRRRAGAATRP